MLGNFFLLEFFMGSFLCIDQIVFSGNLSVQSVYLFILVKLNLANRCRSTILYKM